MPAAPGAPGTAQQQLQRLQPGQTGPSGAVVQRAPGTAAAAPGALQAGAQQQPRPGLTAGAQAAAAAAQQQARAAAVPAARPVAAQMTPADLAKYNERLKAAAADCIYTNASYPMKRQRARTRAAGLLHASSLPLAPVQPGACQLSRPLLLTEKNT